MRFPTTPLALAAVLACASPAFAAQPEPIPAPPTPLGKPVAVLPAPESEAADRLRMELVTGGYQFHLPKAAAEKLREFLTDTVDADKLGELLTEVRKDEKADPRLMLVAGVLAKDIPAFKKELNDKMGDGGVTVRFYGVRRGKDRPKLRAIAQVLPEPARDAVTKVGTVIKTLPLHWTVSPRPAAEVAAPRATAGG